MLKISLNKIKKYHGGRLLFECESLFIYSGEKIAVTGINGVGKTSLLDILAGVKIPDEGYADIRDNVSYVRQLEDGQIFGGFDKQSNNYRGSATAIMLNSSFSGAGASTQLRHERANSASGKTISEFDAPAGYETHLSGGEKTRRRLASAFENTGGVLILDEPTSNLDISAIKLLEEKLDSHGGTLIIVSHDRSLLDKICTRVIEIENSKINCFNGNFASYEYQKKIMFERAEFERGKYLSEKKRLEQTVADKKQKSKQMKKTPKRMGNSEARLHKRGINSKKKKIDSAAVAIKSRLEQLEFKEKPYSPPVIKITVPEHGRIHSRVAASCSFLSKSFDERIVFDGAVFELPSEARTALTGPNGSGKTTLVRMILGREGGIWVSEKANIGYFGQNFETLDCQKTVLENVLSSSVHPETVARTLLACLLFRRDEVYKKAAVLSGGERVKTAIAKILLGGYNFLVLDEPTNYLDVFSLAALEEVLCNYNGAMLLCSHDRRFINAVADRCLIINEKYGKIITYEGKYADYEAK